MRSSWVVLPTSKPRATPLSVTPKKDLTAPRISEPDERFARSIRFGRSFVEFHILPLVDAPRVRSMMSGIPATSATNWLDFAVLLLLGGIERVHHHLVAGSD